MTKHRAHGEGTIGYDEKRDRWQGKLVLPSGKRKSVYGKKQHEVKAKLAQLRREVDAGLHGTTSGEQTFLAFAQGWYDHHRPMLEPRTVTSYGSILRCHFDGIGQVPLAKLTPVALQQHYTRKLGTRASTTVAHIHAFFHVVLENAVKLGILPRNPSDSLDAPPLKPKEFTPLSEAQLLVLKEAVRGDPYEAAYVLAVSTGMREAELLGLCWEDIDWQRQQVRVEQTLKRLGDRFELRRTKSRASRRTIPLPAYAAQVLRAWQARQAQEHELMGTAWGETWGLVFTTLAGQPIHYSHLLYCFRRVLKRAGLPVQTRIHDLRHTFATLLLKRGVHIKVVSGLLGHNSVEITLRIYGHVTPRMQGTAVAEINALLPALAVANTVATHQEAQHHDHHEAWIALTTGLRHLLTMAQSQVELITVEDHQEFQQAQAVFIELHHLLTSQQEPTEMPRVDIAAIPKARVEDA